MHRCKSKRWPASASITTSFMNGLCCQNQIIAEEDSSTRYSQADRIRGCHGTLIFRQISQPYLNQGGHAPHITTGYWSPRFSNLPTVLTAKKPLDRRVISCLKRSYRKPRGTQLPTQNIYQDSKPLALVVTFAAPVKTSLWAVWAEKHAKYT